jgi:hypothetical protein
MKTKPLPIIGPDRNLQFGVTFSLEGTEICVEPSEEDYAHLKRYLTVIQMNMS